jgi:hypothetical protein
MTITSQYAKGNVNPSGDIIHDTDLTGPVSDTACETVVNKPYVSVYGNDVYAGGVFMSGGACSGAPASGDIRANLSGTRGSGVQLAAFAMNAIDKFASAKYRTSSPQAPTGLTFANTSGTGTYGGSFGAARCIPDYFGDGTAGKTFAPTFGGFTDGPQYVRPAGGTLEITGATIGHGQQSALYVDGNVVISNDILYDLNSWSSVDDIPSLYVVAKGNIYITGNVSQLNGVFVAQPGGGTIYTCAKSNGTLWATNAAAPAQSEAYQRCNNQLTVYGSFIAQQVRLLRVNNSLRDAGGDNANGTSNAAEVFKFSPEAYLVKPAIPATGPGTSEANQYYTTLPPVL